MTGFYIIAALTFNELRQDQVHLNWEDITSSGNASMAVSTMFGTAKKFTIWHFGFSRSPGNRFARQYMRQ